MATARDVIALALKDIGVLAAEDPVEAADAADALDTLNQMLTMWEAEGINLGFAEVALGTALNVPKFALLAIRHNLAVLLAPSYGAQASPTIQMLASNGKNTLQLFSVEPQEATFNHLPGAYRRYDVNQE